MSWPFSVWNLRNFSSVEQWRRWSAVCSSLSVVLSSSSLKILVVSICISALTDWLSLICSVRLWNYNLVKETRQKAYDYHYSPVILYIQLFLEFCYLHIKINYHLLVVALSFMHVRELLLFFEQSLFEGLNSSLCRRIANALSKTQLFILDW